MCHLQEMEISTVEVGSAVNWFVILEYFLVRNNKYQIILKLYFSVNLLKNHKVGKIVKQIHFFNILMKNKFN